MPLYLLPPLGGLRAAARARGPGLGEAARSCATTPCRPPTRRSAPTCATSSRRGAQAEGRAARVGGQLRGRPRARASPQSRKACSTTRACCSRFRPRPLERVAVAVAGRRRARSRRSAATLRPAQRASAPARSGTARRGSARAPATPAARSGSCGEVGGRHRRGTGCGEPSVTAKGPAGRAADADAVASPARRRTRSAPAPRSPGVSAPHVESSRCSTTPSASASRILAEPGCSGCCWLGVRRPAGQGDDLEGGGHAAVGVGEPLGVDLEGAGQHARGSAGARARSTRTLVSPMARRSAISFSGWS